MILPLDNPKVTAKYEAAARFAEVQTAKRDRARRLQHLPSTLFAEPAWDILLELYAFALIGREVSQSELLIRITAPSSTSLRWLKAVEAEGLVSRKIRGGGADPTITLTGKGRHALDTYFDAGASPLELAGNEVASGGKLRVVRRDYRFDCPLSATTLQSTGSSGAALRSSCPFA